MMRREAELGMPGLGSSAGPAQARGRRWHCVHGVQGTDRYSAGIIDGDMDEVPAGIVLVPLAVARHAVAGLAEMPQLL